MRTLLTIIVISWGGPPGARPGEIPDSNIKLLYGEHVVATTENVGNISLKLNPGTYTVTATASGAPCQTRRVKLGRRKKTIEIGCVIP